MLGADCPELGLLLLACPVAAPGEPPPVEALGCICPFMHHNPGRKQHWYSWILNNCVNHGERAVRAHAVPVES